MADPIPVWIWSAFKNARPIPRCLEVESPPGVGQSGSDANASDEAKRVAQLQLAADAAAAACSHHYPPLALALALAVAHHLLLSRK